MKGDEITYELIGHLQVCDVPLVSLYKENGSANYWILVRVFNNSENDTYLARIVEPKDVIRYMNGELSIIELLLPNERIWVYRKRHEEMNVHDFIVSNEEEKQKMMDEELSSPNYFDKELSYKSVALKEYLEKL